VLTEIADTRESTTRLDVQITRIDQLHQSTLNSPDPNANHGELESLAASTSALINSIKSHLNFLATDTKRGGPEAERKATLVNSQRKRLSERVQQFQKVEKQYRDRLRERAIREYKIGKICRRHRI